MSLNLVKVLDLPKILDERGNLSFLEEDKQIPFQVKRAYWIYDVPGGERRGGHSYKENQEVIVALSGCFDIVLTDGIDKRVITLNRSYYALYVPPGVWRHFENFSTNSLVLIAASTNYAEEDYERNYDLYLSRNDND